MRTVGGAGAGRSLSIDDGEWRRGSEFSRSQSGWAGAATAYAGRFEVLACGSDITDRIVEDSGGATAAAPSGMVPGDEACADGKV